MENKKHLQKTNGFEQLVAWQKAQELAVTVYQLTKKFPADERFALTDQIRRAASSISANLAEGYGRRGINDKIHFYIIAYGSLLELKSHLYLAVKLGYASMSEIEIITNLGEDCQKLINALVRSIKQNEK